MGSGSSLLVASHLPASPLALHPLPSSRCGIPAAPPQLRRRSHAPRPLGSPVDGRAVIGSSDARTNSDVAHDKEGVQEKGVPEGYTMNQICDALMVFFLEKRPQTKEWRKLLVLRGGWEKYRDNFYKRCQEKADGEEDQTMKQKLLALVKKLQKIDNEMEKHAQFLKEIRHSPLDIDAFVVLRRKDFTEDFFRYLNLLSEVSDSLDERDEMARLGAKCLSAIQAYDYTIADHNSTMVAAQSKFDEIMNSASLDDACAKIKSMAKSKELDSSLILVIYGCWAAAKQNPKLADGVKNIMYHLYKTTKRSIRSIASNEIKLIKYLLNIEDPEERFSALASAFSPGGKHEVKKDDALYSTPKELHKWIQILLDEYANSKEGTEMREARAMSDPVVINRLYMLQETIEEEFLHKSFDTEKGKGGGGGFEFKD